MSFFFSKMKKKKRLAQGKPQLKFESNPYSNFRDNRCHRRTTDDGRTSGRTTDACAMTVTLLTKSSRAKNQYMHIQNRM